MNTISPTQLGLQQQQQQQMAQPQQQQQQQQEQAPEEQNDLSISGWLQKLALSAYLDLFLEKGLSNMYQLQDFTLEELQQMKIGTPHRNKLWRSLVEFRNSNTFSTPDSQDIQQSSSTASTVSVSSHSPFQNNAGNFFEVTRYTFKHTVSVKKEDHDYC